MGLPGFEWDSKKAQENISKHRISFETAQYVFSDPERLERYDQSESHEERWQTIGKIEDVLLVVYAERGTNKRLVSARPATKAERRSYNGYYTIDGKGWTKAL